VLSSPRLIVKDAPGVGAVHRKGTDNMVTSKKDASLAGKQLASKSATKAEKEVAGSALAQAKGKPQSKGKGNK
jgi:hypothetical protein